MGQLCDTTFLCPYGLIKFKELNFQNNYAN